MDQLRSELKCCDGEGARWAGVLLMVALLGTGCSASGAPSHAGGEAPRLAHAVESPLVLGREVLAALGAGNVARLEQLALAESEFRATVWPVLPASRPEVGLPVDYAWRELHQKSKGHLRETLETYRGVELELLDVQFQGETTQYGDFQVHRDSVLVVRTPSGETRRIRVFGSTIDSDRGVKVFSYVVD